jgi:5-methylcytosine-specific restriction endonuclease McrA
MDKEKVQELIQDFLYRQVLVEMNAVNMPFEDYLKAIGQARSDTIKQNGLERHERIQLNWILARYMHHSYRHYLYAIDPTCQLCLQPFATIEETTIDHIVPVSIGGSNAQSNKQLAHGKCNIIKGNRNIRSFHEKVPNSV